MYASGQREGLKYMDIEPGYFKSIDTEEKAYLLGWIASQMKLESEGIMLNHAYCYKRDFLHKIKEVSFRKTDSWMWNENTLIIPTPETVDDICAALKVDIHNPNVSIPEIKDPNIVWDFIRGWFDHQGEVYDTNLKGRSKSLNVRCTTYNLSFVNQLADFSKIPFDITNHGEIYSLIWSGNNALDFLGKMYDTATIYFENHMKSYNTWSKMVCGINYNTDDGEPLTFIWEKCDDRAVAPYKERASDSGYDVVIIDVFKKVNSNTIMFETGIKIQPEFGWYIDVVPRSSMSKTGYILSNLTGIIDRQYRGTLKVVLTKVNPDCPDIELPNRIVQMIPRLIVNVRWKQGKVEESERSSGGFGSTGKEIK